MESGIIAHCNKIRTKPWCGVELVDGVAVVDDTNDAMLLLCDICAASGIDGIDSGAGEHVFSGVAPVLLQLLSLLYSPMWNFGLYGRSTVFVCDKKDGAQSRSSVGDVGRLKCCAENTKIVRIWLLLNRMVWIYSSDGVSRRSATVETETLRFNLFAYVLMRFILSLHFTPSEPTFVALVFVYAFCRLWWRGGINLERYAEQVT